MAYHYSASTGGFYLSGVHEAMPEDAVAITDAQHAALMQAQSEGKIIAADDDGNPEAIEPPELGEEELLEIRARNRAAAYQAESDPLFFKWQRGEATEQEWLNKIEEIKSRYP